MNILQKLLHQSGRTLVPNIRLDKNFILHEALQTAQEYGTQIVIISMNKVAACSLLKEAKKMDFFGQVLDGSFLILNLALA